MFPSSCQRPAGVWGAVQLRLSQVPVTGGAKLRQRSPQLPQRAFPAAAEGLRWGGAAAGPAVHHSQVEHINLCVTSYVVLFTRVNCARSNKSVKCISVLVKHWQSLFFLLCIVYEMYWVLLQTFCFFHPRGPSETLVGSGVVAGRLHMSSKS